MSSNLVTLFCDNQQSEHTAKNAGYRLRAFAGWLELEHSITDLEAVTVAHILSYKQHLGQSGLAPTSQARALETIRSFFRWCCEVGLLGSDPAKSVKSPRAIQNQEPEYLETAEVKQLFDVVGLGRQARRGTAMLWCLSLGLRVGEVVGLDVADVLPPANGSLAGLSVDGKRAYHRTVPLSQAAYQALRSYLDERGPVANDAPLFESQKGGRISTRQVERWFADLVQLAGLDKSKGHPHAARHGFAMRMLYQSSTPGGIFTVSRMMGHKSLQTTQRYLHVGPMGRAAMESAIMSDPLLT